MRRKYGIIIIVAAVAVVAVLQVNVAYSCLGSGGSPGLFVCSIEDSTKTALSTTIQMSDCITKLRVTHDNPVDYNQIVSTLHRTSNELYPLYSMTYPNITIDKPDFNTFHIIIRGEMGDDANFRQGIITAIESLDDSIKVSDIVEIVCQ